MALRRVADMMCASNWAADYLNRHPLLLNELLDPRLYEITTDWTGFREILRDNLAQHADDTEREMDILREMHHGQVFRLLAQDLAGLQTIERLSDHLPHGDVRLVEHDARRGHVDVEVVLHGRRVRGRVG